MLSNWKYLVPLVCLAASAPGCAQMPGAPAQGPDSPLLDFKSCTKPHYPQAELAAGHEGTVTLMFRVEPGGAVSDSKIARSSGFPALDETARAALAKCRFFSPKTPEGEAVPAWTMVQYVWTRS
jgi:bla regulator protein BlaR1